MAAGKICLIGSRKPYPAFDSLSSNLKDILGQTRVIELRCMDWMSTCPRLLKIPLYLFQDLVRSLKIIFCHNKKRISAVLIFQAYYPMSCIVSSLLNLKLLRFIGGSSFYGSYLEAASTISKVFSYANLPMAKICHKFADMLITLSESMVKNLGLENYKDKVRFAQVRVDRSFFDKFRIIKSYKDRSNIVGFVGLLSRGKGVLNLIQAITLVVKRKNDCRFIVIGSGPLLETIKTKVQKLELDKSVSIMGFVNCNYLGRYYNEMKIFVFPSYDEGIPSVISEAMACGAAVLATPVGGITDVIKDGETGFLLKSNNPSHIAEKIVDVLNKPELVERVSENAYKRISENFSYESTLDSWRRILQDLGLSMNDKEAELYTRFEK